MNEKPNIQFKSKTPLLLASLPEYLKDPANFEKIQKDILATFATTCSHGEVLEWANCVKCTKKMLERRRLLKRLGFKAPSQYFAWRKVHEEIRRRYPLVDWSKENALRTLKNQNDTA